MNLLFSRIALLLLVSSPALAITDADLFERCMDVGIQKITAKVAALPGGCEIDQDAIKVDGFTNHWYSSAKAIRLSVPSRCAPTGTVTDYVQFWRERCF
jgi:hypothetical protein